MLRFWPFVVYFFGVYSLDRLFVVFSGAQNLLQWWPDWLQSSMAVHTVSPMASLTSKLVFWWSNSSPPSPGCRFIPSSRWAHRYIGCLMGTSFPFTLPKLSADVCLVSLDEAFSFEVAHHLLHCVGSPICGFPFSLLCPLGSQSSSSRCMWSSWLIFLHPL
jgi:hypothetical protein